ncbi:hypothetical protein ASZ90_017755 [hydrocarbon metagenome]|uniref:Uncharacterized protein n=1 Tax=hydrocarbon metagenome TaxID=938273 RepID=A0A0W8E8B8_9ZZZZ
MASNLIITNPSIGKKMMCSEAFILEAFKICLELSLAIVRQR